MSPSLLFGPDSRVPSRAGLSCCGSVSREGGLKWELGLSYSSG